ncbi:MAG: hypothetical protein RBG13Loki_1874, partial [Promethearchaeota archaeon CR_4]
VPEQANSFFTGIGISLKQFYLAETFATIIEIAQSIVTQGFTSEELGSLNAFLRIPVKALEKPEKKASKKVAKKIAKKTTKQPK